MATSQRMQDKICLVTGATSGQGKETALGLARMGATVVLVARNKRKGEQVRYMPPSAFEMAYYQDVRC